MNLPGEKMSLARLGCSSINSGIVDERAVSREEEKARKGMATKKQTSGVKGSAHKPIKEALGKSGLVDYINVAASGVTKAVT